MAINFTNNIAQYTSIQRAIKAKQFMEYGSKKQLQDAEVLTDKELKFVTSIKGTFNFALHVDGRYMAVTLYRAANSERKYNFLVLDLQTQAVAEVGSIKEAKAEIMELVELDNKPAEQQTEETQDMGEAMEAEDAETASAVHNVLEEFLGEQPAEDKKSRKNGKNA